jgi:hypothetical protein
VRSHKKIPSIGLRKLVAVIENQAQRCRMRWQLHDRFLDVLAGTTLAKLGIDDTAIVAPWPTIVQPVVHDVDSIGWDIITEPVTAVVGRP